MNRQQDWKEFALRAGSPGLAADPRWLPAVCDGLRQEPYAIEASDGGRVVGFLLLSLVKSPWFGRFLVSLPYVNTAGVVAADDHVATCLVDRAVQLADELDVRYLELRHELERSHPALSERLTSKVRMRLKLPASPDALSAQLKPKVRNQVRKAEKQKFAVDWGGLELLDPFYEVFSRNMRDLGTPVFGRRLFSSILARFSGEAEFCIVRKGQCPVAAGLLLHGNGVTQVPRHSSLRSFNATSVNMLMYWNLLERAISRGQGVFDFGRSSADSNTFQFKSQWGAQPQPAVWQYYVPQRYNKRHARRERQVPVVHRPLAAAAGERIAAHRTGDCPRDSLRDCCGAGRSRSRPSGYRDSKQPRTVDSQAYGAKETLVITPQFLDAVCEALGREPGTLTLADSNKTVPQWDSLGHLSIITMIDERLKTSLNTAEMQNFTTLSGLVELLKAKGAIKD